MRRGSPQLISVAGYTKSDGTRVRPHMRTASWKGQVRMEKLEKALKSRRKFGKRNGNLSFLTPRAERNHKRVFWATFGNASVDKY